MEEEEEEEERLKESLRRARSATRINEIPHEESTSRMDVSLGG